MRHVCIGALLVAGLVVGCAQEVKAPQMQPTHQATETAQESKAAGGMANIYVINAPGKGVSGEYTTSQGDATSRTAKLTAGMDNTTGSESKDAAASYLQHGVTINVTMGSTVPTQTGTTSATQTPSQTGTWTTTATPTASVPISLGFAMPGGYAAPNAVGTTGAASPANLTPNQAATINNLLYRAAAGDKTALLDLVKILQSLQTPTSSPSQ